MPETRAAPDSEWGSSSRLAEMRRLRPKALAAGRAETDLLLEAADLHPGLRILDLACGAGTPALDEARRVGPNGHVTGVDPAESLISLAREYAREEGLAHTEFRAESAEKLSFLPESFDRVTCRFGAMYFTDLSRAVFEARRVLRRAGRIAWLVWGPIEQPYFRSTVLVAMRHAGLPRLPPEAMQPFCFAEAGTLSRAISDGGFVDVREFSKEVMWSWPGSAEEVCDLFFARSPPFKGVIDALNPVSRVGASAEIIETLRTFESNGQVTIPETVVVATGIRP